MYARHFGLREDPFGAAPDAKFLYFSPEHAEALAGLHYGLRERRGVLVLVARPGLGKTILLRHLLDRWKEKAATAFLYRPPETREEMIAAVLEDLGVAPGPTYADNCRRLRDHAAEVRRRGRRLLLVFDEAQGMPPEVLEEIRRLSNLELIDIILAGHPELASQPEAFRQRVGVWAELGELSAAEVRRYVEHRLRVAGRLRGRVFTDEALRLLAALSGGIPRNINTLCFQALSAAFARGKKRVGVAELQPSAARRPRLRWAAASVVLALGMALGAGHARRTVAPPATVAAAPAPAPLPPPAPPPPPPAPVATAEPEPERVQVQHGETMRRIAIRHYGRWDPQVWQHIQKSNPGLADPGRLRAGQILVLPPREDQS
jgi:general secretion pathway protein A